MTDITTEKHQPDQALFLIHLLTALGAPIALAALLAGSRGDWGGMFALLGLALVVDGVDGPLARKYRIAERLPRWSGASLDFVIDYATYVFLPAFAVSASTMLSGPWNWICGALIVFTGALYFADNGMKTSDGAFKGFPAVWNMVIFGLMVLSPSETFTIAFIVLCCVLTFTPIKFSHPVRVKRWRVLTLSITLVWFVAAGFAIAGDMSPEAPLRWILTISSLYLFGISAFQQLLDRFI